MRVEGWVHDMNWADWAESNLPRNDSEYWSYDPKHDAVLQRYLYAMFIAMTDETANTAKGTTRELIVAMVLHLIYECIYGFVLGVLMSLVLEARKSTVEFEEKIIAVQEFCQVNKIGPHLSTPMMHFFHELYPNEKVIDTRKILQELPPGLR